MSYELVLADPAYSTWSMRAYLCVEQFAIPYKAQFVAYRNGTMAEQLTYGHAKTVPLLILPSGQYVTDSLAIAEELASRHPDAGLWPADPDMRAMARSLAAEMHSGFTALRSLCPMNLRIAFTGVETPPELLADLARIETLWSYALETSGGPWLAGEYSIADAFFAPVAARILGHNLPVGSTAMAYCRQHLAEPTFQKWQRIAQEDGEDLDHLILDWDQTDWPS